MAPDLNSLSRKDSGSGSGRVDYTTLGSTGYSVPNITLNDPQNRRLKVLSIGAGVSGILMAYNIQKEAKNVEFNIYEKNHDIGGTWLENKYPGAACDIPSHAYTYNFALWPDWPKYFSYAPDIFRYLNLVCDTFGLRKYMHFDSKVVGCYWQEDEGQWLVKLEQKGSDGQVSEIEERCDLLLYGTGILNNYKWPNIPGLEGRFKGKVVHTANWPDEYQKESWKDDNVAVIGSGASSTQTVPAMQPYTKHIDVFVRTGVWFTQLADNTGQNTEYTPEQRETFRKDPAALVAHAKNIENKVNGLWGTFYSDSQEQKAAQEFFKQRTKDLLKDQRLFDGFTPTWGVGCRRICPGDPYLEAIQKDNVDVHFTAVDYCTEDGIVGGDGVERKCDTIICATGFDVTYRPRFPLVGLGGMDLAQKWEQRPEGYLGLAAPDMPNMIAFVFPTWPVENGSVMGPLQSVAEYTLQIIRKMQNENIKSWVPRQDITDRFNEHAQEWVKHTVWKEDCRSWYKNNDTGRVNAIWPGSSLHYAQMIVTPRYEDFDIKYHYKNPWAFMGMGYAQADRDKEHGDLSPYLQIKNIDPKWLEAVGSKPPTFAVVGGGRGEGWDGCGVSQD